ncbi:MAG: type II secretion system protein [bacterium]
MRTRLSQQGLTLLEILVAMFIFSIILGVVYSTFFGSSKTASLIESNEDAYQTARSFLGMISLELRALYYDSSSGLGLSGVNKETDGDAVDEIYFISTSYQRTSPEAREGEIAEIGYFFDVDPISGKKRLIRSVDSSVDSDIKDGGTLMLLTEQVKSLDIKYYKKDTKEWLDEWQAQSQPQSQASPQPQQQQQQQQPQLPDEIRIELSVVDDHEHETKFHKTIQPVLMR